jgi:hypothetical protein
VCASFAAHAHAQNVAPVADGPDGVIPDAAFQLTFRKYTARARAFAPFDSWDGAMDLDVTAFRRGPDALGIDTSIQVVGVENLHGRVGVGATGYFLGFGYRRASHPVALSASFRHLSSHPTRDLDDKDAEVRSQGRVVPSVIDPTEYNIVYVQAAGSLARWPFEPAVRMVAVPIAFRFNGAPTGDVRRLYVDTQWTLWEAGPRTLLAETQHEIGSNGFDVYSLQFDLARRADPGRRLQILLSIAPGHGFHVSPIAGGVLDGIALGLRFTFRS